MDTLSWEEPLVHRMKVERNLNFSTISNEEDEFGFSRKKTARDPMSHRIIEKRRRDRMNNCLADLSRLVPTNYLKKGRGRIEKTEIIEMAIKHLKHLQAHPCKDPVNCEVAKTTEQDHKRQYRLGYQECMSETIRFMVESEGLFSSDGICVRLINHLQKHYDKVAGGMCYTQALGMMASEDTKSNIQMDVDNHSTSCCPSDTCSDGGVVLTDIAHVPPPATSTYSYENHVTDANELKRESEVNPSHPMVTNHHESEIKVTSQLREMLQNPGLPKDTGSRCYGKISGNVAATSPLPQPISAVSEPHMDTPKSEEVYKFKNNIKHRFNADLRHHTSSPTDSHHSDHMSLPDEDKLSTADPLRHCTQSQPERLGSAALLCHNSPLSHGHVFSPYSSNHNSELSVKIPDRTVSDNVAIPAYGHWDSHAETASSCGSNPSPPPVARSNGSSSGYSTNGENNGPTKTKPNFTGLHSPAVSPYSRTPDRLSNRSPSPQPGVPIFALHPKGTYYIPLTVESSILAPYLLGVDDLAPVLHPISICVNLSNQSLKVDKVTVQYRQHSSFLMDKYHDRYIHADRPSNMYYPCSSPARNGCS